MIPSDHIKRIFDIFSANLSINKDEGLEAALKLTRKNAKRDPKNAIGLWWPTEALAKYSPNDVKVIKKWYESKLRAYERKPSVTALAQFFGRRENPSHKGEQILFERDNIRFCSDIKDIFEKYSKHNDFSKLRFNLSYLVDWYKLNPDAVLISLSYFLGSKKKAKKILKRTQHSEALLLCDLVTHSEDFRQDLSDRCAAYFIERLIDIAPKGLIDLQVKNRIVNTERYGESKLVEERDPLERKTLFIDYSFDLLEQSYRKLGTISEK